jgi:DDE superfamily endonuclease
MPILPVEIMTLLACFAPLFSARTWSYVPALVAGSILTPHRRQVGTALRALGLAQVPWFQNFHRVLNRAVWSPLAASRVLLGLLVAAFAPEGPLLMALDDTLERRRGAHIAAKGIYRDPVRSSAGHFVKASGLRWLCLMLLVPLPWAGRTWALPFLTILAPSERHDRKAGRRHKTLTDWARQALLLLRRWLPRRALVIVADSGYAAIELLARCARPARPISVVTRLRLDAALYEPAPPRRPRQNGRPRVKGRRLPTLAARLADPATAWTPVTVANWYGEGARTVEVASDTAVWYHAGLPPVPIRWVLVRDPQGGFDPQALLCTDLAAEPAQILAWFVLRWQLEVTFEEARRHLGVESQRQWSDRAVLRTTPALLGLFSLVTLWAHPRMAPAGDRVRQAAWYHKPLPTFADALALVRREIWGQVAFGMSDPGTELVKVPRALVERFADALCYAA